ncbi:Eco57I restriction-modification methylase domain-containing protein [Phascolarctobacterium succinatutens]|uniref:Eco57I restriction-modification methylase domain-containing protein n=1 Tax=Phascolarctobacterium succinatutens TaxID=626940 RepID=UPI0026EC4BC4|nr:Eco57I restriction-modification methylase domain-containing protein [Phascolarctobacterium succinatutens]
MNAIVKKIEMILKSSYDTKNYVDLIREIFPKVSMVSPDKFRKEFTNFSSHIEGSVHVGNYKTPDKKNIIIMAVQLKNVGYVENSRSTQRSYAKKLIENANADAAFIAFYTECEPKWRLSFVRLDYEMKIENGRLKTTENLTPAKRYSYLVGENEPCHTAISRFERFIIDSMADPERPTLDDLENVFSVEKVTDEFFKLYCEKYHQLREKLEENEDFCIEAEQHNFTSAQFAKKLMGQIVFLYFLQKKGWLGVGAWPNTLNEKEYKNAFYARGAKSRELMPMVYRSVGDGTYRISGAGLNAISDEDEAVLAMCVKGKPWGSGPHNFMRRLFEIAEKKNQNFFDELLEPLFYDALNVNRGEQGYCPALHCRIPFLSGGLFEPMDGYDWEHNNFDIPNEVFSNAVDKGREADGILDIFDRYNFTMSEDEPMEREVAIDPEMLGKVFENLLEVNDRKSKGAFYTPREIVHYMCQESLINYLTNTLQIEEEAIREFILYGDFMCERDTEKTIRVKDKNGKIHMEFDFGRDLLISSSILSFKENTNRLKELDEALKNVRVADPAVGSGAFPLGMLNEIVRARQNISAYMAINMNTYNARMMYQLDRSPHNLKRETIKNCIFAADIEPSAVDIAQLRLWLSLVIDDEINPKAQSPLEGHKNPLPLPNLECNILCGNSLIDEFEGTRLIKESDIFGDSTYQLDMNHSRFESIVRTLIEKQNELFRCDNTEKKKQLKDEIESLRDMVILSQLEGCGSEKIQRYHESKQMASKPYVLWQLDFARVFREKGGFDIVIGNPPYIGEEGNKEIFQEVANTEFGKKYYIGKMDFWYFFTSKGLLLLAPNGLLSFIAPNNWMTTAGGKNMRKHIAKKGKLKKFVTFNNVMVFESASQQTMIFLIQNKKQDSEYKVFYKAVGNRSLNASELSQFLNGNNIGIMYNAKYDPIVNSDGRTIQFLDTSITDITDKIKRAKCFYLQNNEILNGIHPHHAGVTKKMLPMLPNSNVGDGIFILSSKEVNDLNLDEKEKSLLHPYYDSKNISRYYFDPDFTKQIIYTTSDFKDVTLMNEYPKLKKHLDFYVDVITSDNRPYGLHRARKQEFFEEPTIVSLRKCSIPQFSYVAEPAYVTAEWYLIKTSKVSMKYLTCLLNSTLIKFWLLKMGKMQGSIYQVDKEPLVNIPILIPDKKTENILSECCDKIYKVKENDKSADISEIEKMVDDVVYSAYALTRDEILTVENTIKEWEESKK